MRHPVDRACAPIDLLLDLLLKQRHDGLPELIDALKGDGAHEQGLFDRVTAVVARLRA